MNENGRTYHKFNLVKNNDIMRPTISCFGFLDTGTNMIQTTRNYFFHLDEYTIEYSERLDFDPFAVQPSILFDVMLRNGLNVEIVTDLWADWDFDNNGQPIRNTATPVDGDENRIPVWRPCYTFFSASTGKFMWDDGGTFDNWGDAFLEAVHFYYSNKDKDIYENGFK